MMVMSDVAANTACDEVDTIMLREAVEVRPHASVNDQDSVYEPPQELCDPVIVEVTVPLMRHGPLAPFV